MSRMDGGEHLRRMTVSIENSEICPIDERKVGIEMKEKENLYPIHSSEISNFGMGKIMGESSRISAYFRYSPIEQKVSGRQPMGEISDGLCVDTSPLAARSFISIRAFGGNSTTP
ncbi:MAG: hypothetical protein IIC64_07310 [SAR324 cluster bacterium]|nr:hypothetical protein [SAR324 cluster bacterium]